MTKLEQMIKELSPDLQRKVEMYIESLQKEPTKRIRRTPTFNWAGGLKDLRNQFSSVDLQHKASDWRMEEK